MPFNNDKAIFLQIADRLSDEILAGVYQAFDRVPSVREYAAKLGVNANTAVKAYDQLAQEGIIFNKRGLGYFVAEDAQRHIKQTRRQTFLKTVLPEFVRQMRLLDITWDDVKKGAASERRCLHPLSPAPASPPPRLSHPVSLTPSLTPFCKTLLCSVPSKKTMTRQ